MEEKYKIHIFYILLILGSIIVSLITVKWTQIPQLVDYITFALTVSSLCLALLAIIYSIYSNTSFSQNINSLEKSTSLLAETSSTLSESTESLSEKVENIPSIIKTVSEKVDITHSLINDMSMQSSQTIENYEKGKIIQDDVLKRFLQMSSYNGLLILYACHLSYKNETPFNFDTFHEKLEMDRNYSFPYAVATNAIGFFKYEDKNDIWIVKSFSDYISSNLSKAIDDKIDELMERFQNSKKFESELRDKKISIENYFNVTT